MCIIPYKVQSLPFSEDSVVSVSEIKSRTVTKWLTEVIMYIHFKMDTEKAIYLKPTRIGCSLFNLTHANVIPTGQVKHNPLCYLKSL